MNGPDPACIDRTEWHPLVNGQTAARVADINRNISLCAATAAAMLGGLLDEWALRPAMADDRDGLIERQAGRAPPPMTQSRDSNRDRRPDPDGQTQKPA